jgi:hypothetical protein
VSGHFKIIIIIRTRMKLEPIPGSDDWNKMPETDRMDISCLKLEDLSAVSFKEGRPLLLKYN